MSPSIALVVTFYLLLQSVMCITEYLMDLNRIEYDEGPLANFSKLQVIPTLNRAYYLNGSITLLEDIDQTVTFMTESSYSPMGNGQFIKTPFGVSPTPACDFFKKTFRSYVQPSLRGKTTFPEIPPEGLCPIPKGVYHFYWVVPKENDNIITQLPRGLWRIAVKPSRNSTKLCELRIFLKISDKIVLSI